MMAYLASTLREPIQISTAAVFERETTLASEIDKYISLGLVELRITSPEKGQKPT